MSIGKHPSTRPAPSAAPGAAVRRIGGAWLVTIHGVIDEHFNDEFVVSLCGDTAPVIFDLDGVVRITSFGVREWMRVLKRLQSERYYFTRCRPMIVAQLNSVAGFGGSGRVVSFYSPYACGKCGGNFEVLVDLRRTPDVVTSRTAPQVPCATCGAAADFDDVEESYFAGLSNQGELSLSAEVEAVIDHGIDVRQPLRVTKTVAGQITGLWAQGDLDRRAHIERSAGLLEGDVVLFLAECRLADDDGLARLGELLENDRARIYLVAVPLRIADGLVRAGALRSAHLVSLAAPGSCSSCGGAARLDLAAQRGRCLRCGASYVVALTPQEQHIAASLPCREPPQLITEFIASHPKPKAATAPTNTPPNGRRTPSVEGQRIGRYEILKRIGAGGMAEVLLGRQSGPQGFEKKVVIKRILSHLASNQDFIDMFLEEARLAARLDHTNIVQIYDLGRDGDDYFIVMQYVSGSDLSGAMRLSRRLGRRVPPEIAARIIAEVCGGLFAAHTHRRDDGAPAPILHRDVSPQNIMLGLDGAVKLTDFGVAKAADTVSNTETGILKGKVIYMSPEQLNGAVPEPRMDIYAAGLTLYVLLTQLHPFHKKSEPESMKAILDGARPNVRELRPDLPSGLVTIVERALAPFVRDRFQTAEELQLALERFLSEYGHAAGTVELARWLRSLFTATRDAQRVQFKPKVPTSVTADTTKVMTPEKAHAREKSDSDLRDSDLRDEADILDQLDE